MKRSPIPWRIVLEHITLNAAYVGILWKSVIPLTMQMRVRLDLFVAFE